MRTQQPIPHIRPRTPWERFLVSLRRDWVLYLMVLPVLVYFFIFHFMPMYGVVVAFKDFSPTRGANDYFLGVEGETYTINEDGTTAQTDWVLKNPDGLSPEQAMLRYSVYSSGANPGLLTDNTFKGGETYWTSLEGNAKFAPYTPPIIWERFPLTAEATEAVSATKGDIDAVIAEYCANFITGKMDIDASWDEYISKLNQAGVEDYIWAYQDAYNTLNGLK